MKNKYLFYILFMLTIILLSTSVYAQTVTIGSQVWTSKNLNVSTYRNGDEIPQVQDKNEWANLTTGAWCYYDNYELNGTKFGKLYNWYAVNDPRGLAPIGYHIPTKEEWTKLSDYLGGASYASKKMKSTSGWFLNGYEDFKSSYKNGTNSSGFSALPGGGRSGHDGASFNNNCNGYWWTSSESENDPTYESFNMELSCADNYFDNGDNHKKYGFSVRCLKGEAKVKANEAFVSFNDDRDGKSYKTIKIGNQIWMATNLAYKPSSGIYSAYNNDINNLTKYGYLYDWSTACNVCPSGWKLPSNSDYIELTNFLGQDFKQKMMEKSAWDLSENASNKSGFSGLPSGMKDHNGKYSYLGLGGYFWTSTYSDQNFSFAREIGSKAGNWASHEFGTNKKIGMSVRCLKRIN